jgi:hypothetical protein
MSNALKDLGRMVDDFQREVEKMKEALKSKFEGELQGIFTSVFEKYPNISSLKWTQFTPYWNDGEPCEFSVAGIVIVDQDENETDEYDEDYIPEVKKISNLFERSTEIMLMAFGDHVEITVDRDGVTVEEYEHE